MILSHSTRRPVNSNSSESRSFVHVVAREECIVASKGMITPPSEPAPAEMRQPAARRKGILCRVVMAGLLPRGPSVRQTRLSSHPGGYRPPTGYLRLAAQSAAPGSALLAEHDVTPWKDDPTYGIPYRRPSRGCQAPTGPRQSRRHDGAQRGRTTELSGLARRDGP